MALTVVGLGVILLLLFGAGQRLLALGRLILRFMVRGLLGLALVMIMNVAAQPVGLRVGVNPVTALVAGCLGVPGMALLIVLRYVLA
jgi:inhibitor of the pro-sigma K processing machinery